MQILLYSRRWCKAGRDALQSLDNYCWRVYRFSHDNWHCEVNLIRRLHIIAYNCVEYIRADVSASRDVPECPLGAMRCIYSNPFQFVFCKRFVKPMNSKRPRQDFSRDLCSEGVTCRRFRLYLRAIRSVSAVEIEVEGTNQLENIGSKQIQIEDVSSQEVDYVASTRKIAATIAYPAE